VISFFLIVFNEFLIRLENKGQLESMSFELVLSTSFILIRIRYHIRFALAIAIGKIIVIALAWRFAAVFVRHHSRRP
jgi:hypothetical protein